jgi:ketol-acid reductoisomerase
MNAPDILQAAHAHMQERAATYDKAGERSMGKTIVAFNAITGYDLTEEQGWLLMGLLKMVRSQQGAYRSDNYEDEAAYAALRGECASVERTDD